MNQIATRPETSINAIGIATGAGGSSIAPQNLGEVVRFAEVMCKADIALPKHLRGNAGACMAVALQALEWRMSPFAVASKSYAVNGQIAYEAQLIMAVINTRSGIEGRLKFRFEGEGPDRVCIAFGVLDGEELEVRSPKFKDITPKNSPLWKSDPDQQHCYYTARAWGRRHTPEVILGVYDREEVEQFRNSENARDVTPSLSERLQMARIEQHEPQERREGFDPDFVTRETDGLSSGQETGNEQHSSAPPSPADDTGSGDTPSSTASGPIPSEQSDDEAGEPASEATDGPDAAGSPADPVSPAIKLVMEECVENMLRDAFSEPAIDRPAKVEKLRAIFLEPQNLGDFPDFVNRCADTARRIIGKSEERTRAKEYLMGRIPS